MGWAWTSRRSRRGRGRPGSSSGAARPAHSLRSMRKSRPMHFRIVACIIAWCGFSGIQILWYGFKAKDSDSIVCAFLKTWCCGICYLNQQYKECGATEDIVKMITKIAGPAQMEMK